MPNSSSHCSGCEIEWSWNITDPNRCEVLKCSECCVFISRASSNKVARTICSSQSVVGTFWKRVRVEDGTYEVQCQIGDIHAEYRNGTYGQKGDSRCHSAPMLQRTQPSVPDQEPAACTPEIRIEKRIGINCDSDGCEGKLTTTTGSWDGLNGPDHPCDPRSPAAEAPGPQ